MRKAILCLSCLVLMGLATSLVAAPESEMEPLSQDVETVEVEQEAVSTESSDAPLFCEASVDLAWSPNYCGDPCSQQGQEVGCIDTSGPVWRRTFCICINGTLTC